MLEGSRSTGQDSACGFIGAAQPAPRPIPAESYPAVRIYAADKPPPRDFGADIEIPPIDPIARALLNVIF